VGESGKDNGKVRVGDNVLHVNPLPYLAEAYLQCCKVQNFLPYSKCFFRYESVLGGYPDFPDIHLGYHPRYQK
jgi:hypothetical protein